MKISHNTSETLLRQALQAAAQESRSIGLSKHAKKQMLQNIIPSHPWYLSFRFAAPAFASILLLVFSSLTLMSKPGDLLYGLKRHIEDTRSSVDDSYDKTLLEQRLLEKNDILQNSNEQNSEQKVNIVDKEIKEIASRIDEKNNADQPLESTQPSTSDIREDSTPHTDDTNHESEPSYRTTESEASHKAAQQVCKDALDARKRAGENINSDLYKTCDNL